MRRDRVIAYMTEPVPGARGRGADADRVSGEQERISSRVRRRVRRAAPGTVADIASRAQPGHPVIFLGLDAADWSLLDVYMARGVMPNLAQLTTEGTSGHVKTLSPALSPLVWTTMMTGTSPLEHGILDFLQFDPVSGNEEPITSSERRVPAIWNMATEAGKRAAVFGLWATFPAETINGLSRGSDRLVHVSLQGISAASRHRLSGRP